MVMANKRCVVLLSGGMDSATVLASAKEDGNECFALSFDYGQKHKAELDASRWLASEMGAAEYRVIKLDLGALGGSALTDAAIDVPDAGGDGIPVTYVPARNTVFSLDWVGLGRSA